MAKKVSKKAPAKRQAATKVAPEGMEYLDVGPGKAVASDDFVGHVLKKQTGRIAALRELEALQDVIDDNNIKGSLRFLDMLKDHFPEIEVSYGKHKFSDLEALFDTKQGEEFISGALVKAFTGGAAVDLSKN